jgi:heme-NO-binding protein
MMGLIPKILVNLVTEKLGQKAVAGILKAADIDQNREYKLVKIYEDDEWQRLFVATCEKLKLSPADAETAYAEYFMEDALRRWAMWFKMAKSSQEFI